jgi:hypothetical protein
LNGPPAKVKGKVKDKVKDPALANNGPGLMGTLKFVYGANVCVGLPPKAPELEKSQLWGTLLPAAIQTIPLCSPRQANILSSTLASFTLLW